MSLSLDLLASFPIGTSGPRHRLQSNQLKIIPLNSIQFGCVGYIRISVPSARIFVEPPSGLNSLSSQLPNWIKASSIQADELLFLSIFQVNSEVANR